MCHLFRSRNTKNPKNKVLRIFSFVPQAQHHLTEGQHHFEQSENIIAARGTNANEKTQQKSRSVGSAFLAGKQFHNVERGLAPAEEQRYFPQYLRGGFHIRPFFFGSIWNAPLRYTYCEYKKRWSALPLSKYRFADIFCAKRRI